MQDSPYQIKFLVKNSYGGKTCSKIEKRVFEKLRKSTSNIQKTFEERAFSDIAFDQLFALRRINCSDHITRRAH